jgi:uncharacterized membrane protein
MLPLPEPLHPAVVHLPIALAVLLPLVALCGAIAIRAGVLPVRAWSGVVLLGLVLVLTSWIALETGEAEEERVERVVAERFIETHEEAAETFMALGVVLLFVTAAGLLAGRPGTLARGASVLLAAALLWAGIQVGQRGGALVYEHGAARAYSDTRADVAASPGWPESSLRGERYEMDDDDD